MAQVARAVSARRRRPGRAAQPLDPVPRHGLPRAGALGQRDRQGGRRRRRDRRGRGVPGRAAHHPQGPGHAREWADSAPSYNRRDALAPSGAAAGQGGRPLRRAGQPVGSKALAADPDDRRTAPRRSATSSRCSRSRGCSRTRTPRPGACRPTPATATSSTTCCPAPLDGREPRVVELTLVRREVDEAMRVTTETLSQVTNLLAIVSAPPIATDHDPPRRGARCSSRRC